MGFSLGFGAQLPLISTTISGLFLGPGCRVMLHGAYRRARRPRCPMECEALMALEILRDSRVRSVEWRGLVRLSPLQIGHELLLSVPWLVLSLWLADCGLYPLALLASFFFFLTGLRQVHNAFHYALGLPRLATEAVMLALSVAMLGAMHAVQFNHVQHHKHCMDDEDMEGMCARLPAWRALLAGPWFLIRMHYHALRR